MQNPYMKCVNIDLFLQGFGVSIQLAFFLSCKINWTRNLLWLLQDEEMKSLQRTLNDNFITTKNDFDSPYIWNHMFSTHVWKITNVVPWIFVGEIYKNTPIW
jgi:hypothetical protein